MVVLVGRGETNYGTVAWTTWRSSNEAFGDLGSGHNWSRLCPQAPPWPQGEAPRLRLWRVRLLWQERGRGIPWPPPQTPRLWRIRRIWRLWWIWRIRAWLWIWQKRSRARPSPSWSLWTPWLRRLWRIRWIWRIWWIWLWQA